MSARNYYLEQEAKKGFKEWSKEGLEFLLSKKQYKEIAITALAKLEHHQEMEFML